LEFVFNVKKVGTSRISNSRVFHIFIVDGKNGFYCENYIVERNMFLTGIREYNNDLAIYELTLSFGNEILNDEKNTKIFLHVHKFIQNTGRFTVK
jgi:hypothetical protein